MSAALDLLRGNRIPEFWQKYCGFVDLDIDEFMTVQRRLLSEQITLLNECKLGDHLMHGAKPRSILEFRRCVPITTYSDYLPYLSGREENVLPERPQLWQQTPGRTVESYSKWVPITSRMHRERTDAFLALLVFASSKQRGDVNIRAADTFMCCLSPEAACTEWARDLAGEGVFRLLAPQDEGNAQERINAALRSGAARDVDLLAGDPDFLLELGRNLRRTTDGRGNFAGFTRRASWLKLTRAAINGVLQRQPVLTRDIWHLKGLLSPGIASHVQGQRVADLWGRRPLDFYSAAESGIVALQIWDYSDMTFFPSLNFLEFLPLAEYSKWASDRAYSPHLLLLNEVVPAETYAMVITNLLGGAFVRYLLGDFVRITATRNRSLDIGVPQMEFYSRIGGLLELGGMSLAEKTVWQAIDHSGLNYVDWVARGETADTPSLHVYIELEPYSATEDQAATMIHAELRVASDSYRHWVQHEGGLLQLSLLPEGAFRRYHSFRRLGGPAQPLPHLNPPDAAVALLLEAGAPAH